MSLGVYRARSSQAALEKGAMMEAGAIEAIWHALASGLCVQRRGRMLANGRAISESRDRKWLNRWYGHFTAEDSHHLSSGVVWMLLQMHHDDGVPEKSSDEQGGVLTHETWFDTCKSE